MFWSKSKGRLILYENCAEKICQLLQVGDYLFMNYFLLLVLSVKQQKEAMRKLEIVVYL